jgi:cystathionine beta-lyase
VLTSPSKTFNVATLDVALAIVPDETLRTTFIAEGRDMAEVTPFGYFAAEAAYAHPECEEWRTRLVAYVTSNRDYACARLAAVPNVRTSSPEASYLLWVDAANALPTDAGDADASVASRLLAAGVGVSDGADFGVKPGCFRINLACSRATLERGLSRIVASLA